MLKMTNNDYKEYCKECASRLYNESGYSISDFRRDTDNVEILPFDLSRFPQLSETTIRWINAFFSEEDTDKNGNYILRGFTYRERTAVQELGLNYGDYADCYSFFAYNNKELLVFEYCEGDISMKIFPDKESYDNEYMEMYEFYKEKRA